MAIPNPIKQWIREWVTGIGSSEVGNQSPVQSVNSKTGDVTVSAGGVIPPSQTVVSYSDLPLTARSQAEIWYVSGQNDIVASTELSPVTWRSVSDFTIVASSAIPDSVASRPDDDSTDPFDDSDGLVLNFSDDFDRFAIRISSNTSGHTRLRVYDYDSSAYIYSDDVSATVAGDTVVVDQAVVAGLDYGVELDAEGSTFDRGFYSTSGGYPFTSQYVDIVARSTNGSQDTGASGAEPICINDVGNPDSVL